MFGSGYLFTSFLPISGAKFLVTFWQEFTIDWSSGGDCHICSDLPGARSLRNHPALARFCERWDLGGSRAVQMSIGCLC